MTHLYRKDKARGTEVVQLLPGQKGISSKGDGNFLRWWKYHGYFLTVVWLYNSTYLQNLSNHTLKIDELCISYTSVIKLILKILLRSLFWADG